MVGPLRRASRSLTTLRSRSLASFSTPTTAPSGALSKSVPAYPSPSPNPSPPPIPTVPQASFSSKSPPPPGSRSPAYNSSMASTFSETPRSVTSPTTANAPGIFTTTTILATPPSPASTRSQTVPKATKQFPQASTSSSLPYPNSSPWTQTAIPSSAIS